MRIEVRRLNEVDVVLVRGMWVPATAPRLRAVIDGRLAEGRVHLIADFTGVKTFDASVAGGLAAAARRAHAAGGSLSAIAAPGVCRDVLAMVGQGSLGRPRPARWSEFGSSGGDGSLGRPRPSRWSEFGSSGGDGRLRLYDDQAAALAAIGVASPVDGERWPESRDITVHALLTAAALLPADCADRIELRKQAIEHGMPLARRLARRFRDRGEPGEDLTQVAMVGLVNAIDGYDPERGCEFAGYATPTIVGELRRYFRDKGWRIRVPRRLQELRLRVNQATAELTQSRGATPTVADIATHLAVTEAEVAEAVEVGQLYHPLSLSAPGAPGSDMDLVDPLGEDDPAIAVVDERESVRPLLATLPERERAILSMRFFGDMTQSQIADRLGISQMHVSRLLSQTLGSLRAALADAA